MIHPVIAIVCDFDGTLGPDTIGYFLKSHGLDPEKELWGKNRNEHVAIEGWDNTLAYLYSLMELANQGKVGLSVENLRRLGSKMELHSGLPDAFDRLRRLVARLDSTRRILAPLEFYIISGGLEETIRSSKIAPYVNGIFGCSFAYNKKGKAIAIKTAVSFTEKTRFVFAVNKGVSEIRAKREPDLVNDEMPHESRRVPFKNIIYIGDGPSDIPCFTLVTRNGGAGIGIGFSDRKGFALARSRSTTVGPYRPLYNRGSELIHAIESVLVSIVKRVYKEADLDTVPSPGHGTRE